MCDQDRTMIWILGEDCAENGHTCPYLAELYGDYDTLCNCTPEQERECAMDI
jgi:hypothetical protein